MHIEAFNSRLFGVLLDPLSFKLVVRLLTMTMHAIAAWRSKLLPRTLPPVMSTLRAIVVESNTRSELRQGLRWRGSLNITRIGIERYLHTDLRNPKLVVAFIHTARTRSGMVQSWRRPAETRSRPQSRVIRRDGHQILGIGDYTT